MLVINPGLDKSPKKLLIFIYVLTFLSHEIVAQSTPPDFFLGVNTELTLKEPVNEIRGAKIISSENNKLVIRPEMVPSDDVFKKGIIYVITRTDTTEFSAKFIPNPNIRFVIGDVLIDQAILEKGLKKNLIYSAKTLSVRLEMEPDFETRLKAIENSYEYSIDLTFLGVSEDRSSEILYQGKLEGVNTAQVLLTRDKISPFVELIIKFKYSFSVNGIDQRSVSDILRIVLL